MYSYIKDLQCWKLHAEIRIIVFCCFGTKFKDKQTTFGPPEASCFVPVPSSALVEKLSTKSGVSIKWAWVCFLEINTSEQQTQCSLICGGRKNQMSGMPKCGERQCSAVLWQYPSSFVVASSWKALVPMLMQLSEPCCWWLGSFS